MKLSQFQFNLPADKIAQEPPRWRDECKLMVLNKKTGEIISIDIIKNRDDGSWVWHEPESLKSLNEDWEDYKPAEPLIKDEKIRKAVRAWAEVNKIEDDEKVTYQGLYWKLYYSKVGQASIQFNVPLRIADGSYTIAELCGEEE